MTLPRGVVQLCRSIMSHFLWGGREGQQKVAWIKWEDICKPKAVGGLGLRDWGLCNKALLGKWRWRLMQDSRSLWSRVIRAKYLIPWEVGNERISNAVKPSAWWQDIMRMSFQECGNNWF